MKRLLALVLALCCLLPAGGMAESKKAAEKKAKQRAEFLAANYVDPALFADHVVYDLPYCGENSLPSQVMHIAFPANAPEGSLPVIMFVHGGSWSSNNSEDHLVHKTGNIALHALARGYAVAFPDYTIKPTEGTKLPNQIYELKAAVRYLRAVAGEYNLDGSRIALIGESAGGHLVNMLGTTNGEAAYDVEAYGNMDQSSDVQAVVSFYSVGDISQDIGVLGMTCGVNPQEMEEEARNELVAFISPIAHVDEQEAPFYFEAGLSDTTVRYTQSCDLYNAIMVANPEARTELHLYPGQEHAVPFFWDETHCQLYLDWLDRIMK